MIKKNIRQDLLKGPLALEARGDICNGKVRKNTRPKAV